MELGSQVAFLCIIHIFWIQYSFCDELSTKSEANKWTCTCIVALKQNFDFDVANCSSSCDCGPVGQESAGNRWRCICSSGGFPRLADDGNDDNCFTSCNCNAGILSELEPPKKQIPSRVILIVMLLCIVLTLLAIICSILLYVCRKDKVQWASDRLTSCSSPINSTSQTGSSVPLYRVYSDSNIKPLLGCIPKTSFLCKGRTGSIHGAIHFSYTELESAACGFSDANLIGVGGSSCVYRGNLRDGRAVAIKRMKAQCGPDAEHVFLAEIELISRLHHCHVVPLLGYCSEHQGKQVERLLVFEYIPFGNLRECLDNGHLEWSTRVGIALGAARGLEYLHEAAAPRILHRDVKSTNILLDENWRAKIADLGMAKHLNDGIVSCTSSPARMEGTFGYFAPEYAIIGRASLKSDVFSFGVVLLELITGRNPIYNTSDKGEESLVMWAMPRLHDSKRVILELPDPQLKGAFHEEEMQVMAYLAKECLLLDPDSRPSMSEVVQILSTIASDSSKRKKLPLHGFQHQCFPDGRGNPEARDEIYYQSSTTEEIKQITSEVPARCIKNKKNADDSSMTLLTTKSRSWRVQDDEVVDLTEPRFESFCLPNVDSYTVKMTTQVS